ncbi:uncharacterized protein PAC_18921 [Phialocephala subalpina]|uniref:LipA and NB-ARC domain protein n=1 Tax=Phialocephala subalpina TaxID=576137 RepID=A0A1L7XVL3_9HELO|nr:uncharacterized protein PAC_18921 [Phialocephala subalpina]
MDPYSTAPPPYRENDLPPDPTKFRIARKPLHGVGGDTKSSRSLNGLPEVAREGDAVESFRELELRDRSPVPPPRPDLSLETDLPPRVTDSQLYASPGRADTGFGSASASIALTSASTNTSHPLSSVSSASTAQSSKSSASEFVQKAYQEARHFAGGLITHPYESTKHYTILRHSHGLVFYQGTSTTLAVSIFADAPLPPDRTIWLQSKGWSGKTGMRMKAFMGADGSWLNVTPSMCVRPEQLKPTDERAWQRDIAHFQKKAKVYIKKNHILRETVIVRLPAEAGDGYFQLVLCIGEKKKVLCSSPTFRLLSTSASPSSMRGASFSTLPLELAAMVASTYARNTAGTIISPVTSVLQNRVQRYMPSWWVQQAATASYDASGAAAKVNNTIAGANGRYDQVRDDSFTAVGQVEIPVDNGPQSPYPIYFVARSEPVIECVEQFHLPAISLTNMPYDVSHKLLGYYFGWARFVQIKTSVPVDDVNPWQQAVISAIPIDAIQLTRANISEASKKNIKIRLIQVYEEEIQNTTGLEIHIMGFIRPDEPLQRAELMKGLHAGDGAAYEAAMLAEVNDVSMAQSILDQPAWSSEAAVEVVEGRRPRGLERVTSGYANTKMAAQRQLDRVPLQKIGVRMPLDPVKERAMVANGFYIQR